VTLHVFGEIPICHRFVLSPEWAEKMSESLCFCQAGATSTQGYSWKGPASFSRCVAAKAPIPKATVERVIELTTREKPDNATHWSTRTMAAAAGISEASVRRIWRAHGLKPHLVETFKVSKDPRFVEKLEAVVGLYLNPPEHALVLCCDEKSQIQALDRTQPGLPLKKGRGQTMTHDYKRNGTATLFAALNTLDGSVISLCQERPLPRPLHPHQRLVAKHGRTVLSRPHSAPPPPWRVSRCGGVDHCHRPIRGSP
jgi:hypothetical protein